MTQHIAFYGKEGVGKTTLATNISAALVETGFTVLLVGCDLDGDSCSLLHGGVPIPGLLDQVTGQTAITLESALYTGLRGVGCVELGRSVQSGMSAADDVSIALKELKRLRVFEQINPDYVLYDISSDGSGAALHAAIRQVDICRLFVVTSADFKALQAANHAFGFLEIYNGECNAPIPMGA